MKEVFFCMLFAGIMLTQAPAQVSISNLAAGEIIFKSENIIVTAPAGTPTSSLRNPVRFETTRQMTFRTATLDMENITSKAQTVSFEATVNNIIINGQVKFVTDDLTFINPLPGGCPSPINISGNGTITFIYKRLNPGAAGVVRPFTYTPAAGQNVAIKLEKVN